MPKAKEITIKKYNKDYRVVDSTTGGIHTDLYKGNQQPSGKQFDGATQKRLLAPNKSQWNRTKKSRKKSFLNASLPTKNENKKKNNWKKWLGISFLVLLFVGIIASIASYYYILTPVRNIRNSAYSARFQLSLLADDFEKKDLRMIDQRFDVIRQELDIINEEIERFGFLDNIGITKGYYQNLLVIQNVTIKSDELLTQTLPELKEILELTGFSVAQSPHQDMQRTAQLNAPLVVESEEDDPAAVALIMSEMPRYLALYESIEPQIFEIFAEVKKIDPDYVTPFGIDVGARESIEEIFDFIDDYPEIANQTTEFLTYIPELLGAEDGETSFVIILQNEAEMRASGGLLTSFGHMSIENGELSEDIFLSDMWNLEIFVSYTLGIDTGYRNIYGQNTLMNLNCGSNYLRAQDAGIYPDLHWTMTTFTDYYDIANQFDPETYPDYDHILIINQTFAENIIKIIEPLEVEGYGEVTAENLFEFIKEETDSPELSYSPERKKIIEDIANVAKEKFFDLELEKVPRIITTFVDSVYAKDLSLATETNEELQQFFDRYGITGRIASSTDWEGDYFHLNEAQNCSLKLNKFVRNSVSQTIQIADDGSIDRDVSVLWEQPIIYSDELELQYSPNARFSYRAWVRVMTPPGVLEKTEFNPYYGMSRSFETDGLTASNFIGYLPVEYYDEQVDKAVSDNIIQFDHRRFSEFDPIPTRQLNVSYTLPDSLNYIQNGNRYELLIQKHPGKSWGETYKLNFEYQGSTYSTEFVLDQDKVVTFRNGIIDVADYEDRLDWVLELTRNISN